MTIIKRTMSFNPNLMSDHITIDLEATLLIGVNDFESQDELNNFKAALLERIKSTGAQIISSRITAVSTSPFCGSLREKLHYDAHCSGEKED